MSDLRKLRDDFVDALAAQITVTPGLQCSAKDAHALLAALDAKPEPPKSAERTAEEILEKCLYDARKAYCSDPHDGGAGWHAAEMEEALRLVAELRAERDALKARIEKAKAHLPRSFDAAKAYRILSGGA